MKAQQASLTAEGIAIMRAIESEKPTGERLFYDPYARHFVRPVLAWVVKCFTRLGYGERRGPGVMGFLLARTRYMDDVLLAEAAGSLDGRIDQLVILGAGYDARAYRFSDALGERVAVFEVDHPATQQVKIARLNQVLKPLPANVVFVPVDFNKDSLGERLAACGYNKSGKTLFIWEGVVYYLEAAAVDATLAFIARHSGPGSKVVFDYTYPSVVSGAARRGEAASMRRYRRFPGEGLTFGIAEGTVGSFLEQRGYRDVRNATAEDLRRLYFDAPGRERTVAPVYAIASATVAGA